VSVSGAENRLAVRIEFVKAVNARQAPYFHARDRHPCNDAARHTRNRTAAAAVMLNPERDSVIRMTSVHDQNSRMAA